VIGETDKDVQDRLAWIRSHHAKYLPEVLVEPSVNAYATGPLVGTPEQIVEKLTGLNDLGMTYAILYFVDAAFDRSSVDLFTKKVIPELAA
jgi:hypothetical protein